MDALDVSRWQFGITTVYHFIFVPLTIGLAPLIAAMQTAWVVTGNTGVVPADQVLRQAVPDQLRDRRGHRHRAGVPVRDELERVLTLRRRHLRRSTGVRRPGRVLLRVDVPRAVDFRLEPAAATGPPGLHLDRRVRRSTPRRSSSSRRTRSCSIRSAPDSIPNRAGRTGRLRRTADEQHRDMGVPSCRRRITADRRGVRRGGVPRG